MHTQVSPQMKRELLQALRGRYQKASRIEKTRILDEYVALTECHRKHAIRLLTDVEPVEPEAAKTPTHGKRIYAEAVREALTLLWEAADRICSKRLKALLPSLITAHHSDGAAPTPGTGPDRPRTRARRQSRDHRPVAHAGSGNRLAA